MGLKKGRFGQFFACTGYPDCKTTKPIGGTQKKADVPLDETCPQCGSKMVLKSGRFGEFTACSNYPTCKYVKHKTIGVKCPECTDGEVVERHSKRGKRLGHCRRRRGDASASHSRAPDRPRTRLQVRRLCLRLRRDKVE